MKALWTAAEVAAATDGRISGNWIAGGVSIDTRSLEPGDLFVALRGPRHDAHGFVAEALVKGAAAALVDHPPPNCPEAALALVADTQTALEGLGRAARARATARIAGITGSVGKTGTKEALRHVLGRQAPTHASAASHNNHWGVPLTLARLPRATAFGVVEMGMNHAGEIASLTALARSHVALVTLIAPAHLAYLGSIEAIADAKAEIFRGLEPGGTAVLNRDDGQFERLARAARAAGAEHLVTFGANARADWRLIDATLGAETSEIEVTTRGRPLRYRLGLPGRHQVLNSLGVLAVVEALGADPDTAAAALAELVPGRGRGRHSTIEVPGGTALLLDESYNANPASMRAALALLGQLTGRKVAILGDMLELGPEAARLHADLAGTVIQEGIDLVFTCGPLMRHVAEDLPAPLRGAHAVDSGELAACVRAALQPGDAVLVKGSLGSRMARIVEALSPCDRAA